MKTINKIGLTVIAIVGFALAYHEVIQPAQADQPEGYYGTIGPAISSGTNTIAAGAVFGTNNGYSGVYAISTLGARNVAIQATWQGTTASTSNSIAVPFMWNVAGGKNIVGNNTNGNGINYTNLTLLTSAATTVKIASTGTGLQSFSTNISIIGEPWFYVLGPTNDNTAGGVGALTNVNITVVPTY